MNRKHDAIFDDVLSDLDTGADASSRASARFLKRTTTLGERLSGELEEKTLRWVDPDRCRMWDRHNRDYALLNEDNCRDLIDGIKAQGRQEFPAIVRPIDDDRFDFEVICGARRHFSVSWLRNNNYQQFKYLVDVREISDEEAFRLADIENREREDISDYERAIDYADAVDRYYGGKQKAMAARLEVSQPWLSRYLQLAKLPYEIVSAFPTIRDLRERNARELKPLLAQSESATAVLAEARRIRDVQERARVGRGAYVDAVSVMRRLTQAGKPPAPEKAVEGDIYRQSVHDEGVRVVRKGRKVKIEFDASISRRQLEGALDAFLNKHFE